ncbi:MAG: hypothetical protein Q9162_000914 [Coniocarpon cinnabarinum]
MSGLEIAGLVLGAFPVVVQLMNGYKKGCQPLGAWLRFRKTFTKLENGISYQETALDTNLRILLNPLVDDDDELEKLVGELKAGGAARKDPDLEEALQRRLGNVHVYRRYCETLESLRQELAEFQQQLGITDTVRHEILLFLNNGGDADEQSLKESPRIDWRFEWDRIRVSWGRDELHQIIDEIERLNNKLGALQGSGEKLEKLDRKRTTCSSLSINMLRKQATALYEFLAKQWPCSCQGTHTARVFLKQKSMISKKGKPRRSDAVKEAPFEISMAVEDPAAGVLTWEGPLACSLEELKGLSTSSSVVTIPCSVANQQSQATHNHIWEFWKKKKKAIKFQDPSPLLSSTSSLEPTPAPASEPIPSVPPIKSSENLSLCMMLKQSGHVLGNPDPLGSFTEGEYHPIHMRMTFTSTARLANEQTGRNKVVVSSMESSYAYLTANSSLVYLSDLLHCSAGHGSVQSNFKALSISERVKLAIDLASSFFYIFETPWYRGDWESLQLALDSQSVPRRNHAALLERRFPDKGKAAHSLQHDAEEAFIRLSICLEELCFGKPLESFAEYNKFCGPDHLPHDGTPRAAAWDIAKQVESQLGPHYSNAVRKCLELALQAQGSSRGGPDFWQQAHDTIIDHLYEVLRYWVSDDMP